MRNEPTPPSGIAFGDLLVAWHIPSKLESALTPTSVPHINRGGVVITPLCHKRRNVLRLYFFVGLLYE